MDGMTFMKALLGGGPLGGAYYFCGEDPYSLNKGVRAVVERTNPDLREMNTTTLRTPSPAEISSQAAWSTPTEDRKAHSTGRSNTLLLN